MTLAAAVLFAVGTPQPAQANVARYDAPISRTRVMVRALDWLRRGIPYSQDNQRARWDLGHGRRYRPDCSGFVSMAWALDPRRPGLGRAPVTWELPYYSRVVAWPRIRRGDILLHSAPANRAEEHVRLFAGWADVRRTRAWIIEQSSTYRGTVRRAVTVTSMRGLYRPYRYRLIV